MTIGHETVSLGEHVTIIRGDCCAVLRDMGADSADAVIGDPPYESNMHKAKAGARGGKVASDLEVGRTPRRNARNALKTLDFSSVESIRPKVTPLMVKVSRGWLIAFCTPEGVAPWRDAIEDAEAKYKRACAWVKPDAPPQFNGQGPAMGVEMFVAAWCGKGHSRWNGGGKRGVYTCLTNAPDRDGRHPTEKPVALMREILRDFTNPGDMVLDPFMGSGTTGIACILEGRRFVGVESDPKYFAIARERIEWILDPAGPVDRRRARSVWRAGSGAADGDDLLARLDT
ncbi:DNA-methyltransferase [Oricola thermophila]|uniref:Methyltransferase n=1 Tax=Oricola thermophila TaxID=2742145 RepID=A0A6N1VH76_9HYPH|nr:site-specific DNA-methyltransferase [Oricola thermophila]QKV20261.1 site-specific DNA-methyltransferase [Oricola thermophila]